METTERLYEVAVSPIQITSKPTKGDRIWEELTASHVSMRLPMIEIVNAVYMGHQITNWHAPLGQSARRLAENWLSSQFICVDLDGENEKCRLDYVSQIPIVRTYASFAHTTMSHTPDKPRCRVWFFLSEPVINKDEWKRMARGLINCFDGVDAASADISRPWLGSPNCDVRIIDKEMSLPYMRYIAARFGAMQEANQVTTTQYSEHKSQMSAPSKGATSGVHPKLGFDPNEPMDETRAQKYMEVILAAVARTGSGSRNNTLNRAAYSIATKLVAIGLISAAEAQRNLVAAAQHCGLEHREANLTIHSAFKSAGIVGSKQFAA